MIRIRARRWLPQTSLVALSAILLAPGLWLGPWLDAAVFVLAGTRIRGGGVPYRDLWDHKPPGSFLLNALGQFALPWVEPWVVSWLLTLVFTAASILIVHDLLRRQASPRAAWLWSVVGLVGIAGYPMAFGGGYTESFALLPVVGAFWIAVSRAPTLPWLAISACLLSIACLMSLQAVPPCAVIAVAAVAALIQDGNGLRIRTLALRGLAFAGAGLALPLAILAWLAAGGALGDAYDQLIRYNAAYRGTSPELASSLLGGLALVCGYAVPVAASLVRMARYPRSQPRTMWLSLGWLAVAGLSIGYQQRLDTHYLILLIPPLALLSSPGLDMLLGSLRSVRPAIRRLALSGVAATTCAFAFAVILTLVFASVLMGNAANTKAEADQASAWIRTNTAPSADMFVWGDDAYLYLTADRAAYDRYVYEFPLVTQGYWSAGDTADLLARWEASPPRLVVEGRAVVPLFEAPQDIGDSRNLDTLEPLRSFVRANYHLGRQFGRYAIYELGAAGGA